MKTKFHVRFFSRIAHLDADIELADILKIAIGQGAMHNAGDPHLFSAVNPQQHPRIAARVSSRHNRSLAANHLKVTLCGSFLKDVYEDLTMYFSEVLEAAARNGLDPNRLIGEHKVSFESNDILSAGSWSKVVDLVAKSVFRKLENERSTKKLVEKMNGKLNLGVPQATIEAALPYLEIRHLLVHSDGKADQAFCDAFPAIGAVAGRRINLNHTLLQDARIAITSLVNDFDQRIIANKVVSAGDTQP